MNGKLEQRLGVVVPMWGAISRAGHDWKLVVFAGSPRRVVALAFGTRTFTEELWRELQGSSERELSAKVRDFIETRRKDTIAS